MCGHAIRQGRYRAEEVRGRDGRLQAIRAATEPAEPAIIAVTFGIDFFEVQRPVTQARGVPLVAGHRPAAASAARTSVDLLPTNRGIIGRHLAGRLRNVDAKLRERLEFGSGTRLF